MRETQVTPDQLIRLEEYCADLERRLEALDDVVRAQADALALMQRQMKLCLAHLRDMQEEAPGAVVLTDLPPHY